MLSFLRDKFIRESPTSLLARLHRDEHGAEAVEKLLLLAVIALPLLGVLIYFRDDITTWISDKWKGIKNKPDPDPS